MVTGGDGTQSGWQDGVQNGGRGAPRSGLPAVRVSPQYWPPPVSNEVAASTARARRAAWPDISCRPSVGANGGRHESAAAARQGNAARFAGADASARLGP